jgi:hypothetical protein
VATRRIYQICFDVCADLHVDAAAFLGVGAVCEIDYGDAGVPMLTETHGRTVTRKHIIAYARRWLSSRFWLVSRRLADHFICGRCGG